MAGSKTIFLLGLLVLAACERRPHGNSIATESTSDFTWHADVDWLVGGADAQGSDIPWPSLQRLSRKARRSCGSRWTSLTPNPLSRRQCAAQNNRHSIGQVDRIGDTSLEII